MANGYTYVPVTQNYRHEKDKLFYRQAKARKFSNIYFQIRSGSPDNIIDEDTFSKINFTRVFKVSQNCSSREATSNYAINC